MKTTAEHGQMTGILFKSFDLEVEQLVALEY